MIARDIIIKPVITEKSMAGAVDKKYTFKVAKTAGKIEIAKAVEEIFGVSVKKVNTINVRGQYRRQGRTGDIHRLGKRLSLLLQKIARQSSFLKA